MRALPLIMACSLFCSCSRTSADARAVEAKTPMYHDKPDLLEVADSVFKRFGTLGYDKLSRPEQVFVCVWGLEGEVNNGGLDQYYFNSSGDYALDAAASLDAIDAKSTSTLIRNANLLFGESGPSPDRTARQGQLDALSVANVNKMNQFEEEFFKSQDHLDDLLGKYVSMHAEVFGLK